MAKTSVGRHDTVTTDLRHRIATGDLAPGDWLPSEAALMTSYDITRYGAREAIKRLAGEGLIVVVDGKGSHVRTRSDRARHLDPRGLTAAGSAAGSAADAAPVVAPAVRDSEWSNWTPAEQPSTYRVNAGTDLALTVGIPEHTPVFGVDRLLAQPDTGRRMHHRIVVPMSACTRIAALTDDPFPTPDSLYALLHTAGITYTATEYVRAALPAPDDIATLDLPTGAAVLITRRILRDTEDRLIAMEETRRNAEDTQLSYTITTRH